MTESMKLQGVDFLREAMEKFGPTVSEKAQKTGVRRAAVLVRRAFVKAAPKGKSGNLRKSIGYKTYGKKGHKQAYIGLRKRRGESRGRWYYRTLEVDHARGKAYNPFFAKAWDGVKEEAAQTIIGATTKAIYTEATKVYRKSQQDQSRYGFRRGRVK